MKICFVAAKPYSVKMFLASRINYAIEAGYQVTVITSYDGTIESFCSDLGARYISIDIERRFTPIKDVISLYKLVFALIEAKPDVIHSISSKGGLLSAAASKIVKIKLRFHIYAGLPWVEMEGIKRVLGRICDKFIANSVNMTYADSYSEREFLINEGICLENQIRVLGNGSVSGFDVFRFQKTQLKELGNEKLKKLGIDEKKIILFLGRVTKDKGIRELVEGFTHISHDMKDVCLIIAGPMEENIDPLPKNTLDAVIKNQSIYYVGFQNKPEEWYAVADFLVLPSYREGFGNVVIEAALAGLPTIGTDIVGLRDSIINNKTGLLVKKKDVDDLEMAMRRMLMDDQLRNDLGEYAKQRAVKEFSEDYVNKLILKEYSHFIDEEFYG